MVSDYNNNRVHSSTRMTPTDASNLENSDVMRVKLYPPLKPPSKPKFAKGDLVRISKKKGIFEKGYTPRWTEEVFTISQVLYTNPITYKIAGLDGSTFFFYFYLKNLQKIYNTKHCHILAMAHHKVTINSSN